MKVLYLSFHVGVEPRLENDEVKIVLGSKDVLVYKDYPGTGFMIEGTACYIEWGKEYDRMKFYITLTVQWLMKNISDLPINPDGSS